MVIYETINLVNGKRYIGQDTNDDPNYLGSGKTLKKAVEKYGRENFRKVILERCNSKEELDEREKHWIRITNAQKSNKYYNIVQGGTGGDNWEGRRDTDEYKEFMSKMKEIRKRKVDNKHKESTKQNQKKAAMGRYTLQWYKDRHGDSEGERLYTERCQRLKNRKITWRDPVTGTFSKRT